MTGIFPQTTPYLTYLFVAALVGITAYFLFRAQRQLQPSQAAAEPERDPEPRQTPSFASLEEKAARLERLVHEADRAAERLAAAIAAVRHGEAAPPPQQAAEVRWEEFESEAPADEGLPANQAAGLRVPGSSGPPRPRPYDEIYALADAGYDPEEIARRLGTPAGEIHLILGLRAAR